MRAPSLLARGLVAVVTTPLAAQRVAERSLSLSAGAVSFDMSGTGTAPVTTLSVAQTLPVRWVALEATAGYAGVDEQFSDGRTTRLGTLEGEAQLQWPAARLRPYLGVGGGCVHYFTNADSRRPTEPSMVFAAGLRAAVTGQWGLRIDGRIRGWEFANATDWAVNTAGELTLGVTRRF